MDRVEMIIYMRTLTEKILQRLFQRKGTKREHHLQKGSPLGDPYGLLVAGEQLSKVSLTYT